MVNQGSGQDDPSAPDTFRLMYRSHDLIGPTERRTELGALFTTARANNKSHDVTGALLLTDDYFVQVLEGPEEVVRPLYETISADPRHDAVELLEAVPVPDRVFGRWSMARVAEDGETDIALIAHLDGIATATRRTTTEAQDALLARMRTAAVSARV